MSSVRSISFHSHSFWHCVSASKTTETLSALSTAEILLQYLHLVLRTSSVKIMVAIGGRIAQRMMASLLVQELSNMVLNLLTMIVPISQKADKDFKITK